MITVAKAYAAPRMDGAEAASAVFAAEDFDFDRAGRSSILRHYIQWLRERGVLP